jgi:type IV secretory pathway TraG/TraD family ATPase VirD4
VSQSDDLVPPEQRSITLGVGDSHIDLTVEDLARHTIVFGNSGSGKTTRAFNPMLEDMLAGFDVGALIIAAKAESVTEAAEIARRAGRDFIVIQPGGEIGLDVLTGSPDVDAMYFRDVFGRVPDDAKPYIDAAAMRVKHALQMLKSAGGQYYTFSHLANYIFDEQFNAQIRIFVQERARHMHRMSDEALAVREAVDYEEKRYRNFSEQTRQEILFSVSQLLEPLLDVQLAKTFARKHNLINIEEIFNGKIIIINVPRSRYERAAQAIYTLAKRRFFTAVENRRANPHVDQKRPVLFAVDEYQLCISETDVMSLGIVRSAGCMVFATSQGVSSLYSVLPKHYVDAALQNFTQKIFFKTDDLPTLAMIDRSSRRLSDQQESRKLLAMNRDQALCRLTAGDITTSTILTMRRLFVVDPFGNTSVAPAAANPPPASSQSRQLLRGTRELFIDGPPL